MTWNDVRKTLYDQLEANWSDHDGVEIFPPGRPLPNLMDYAQPFITVATVPKRTTQLAMAGAQRPKRRRGQLEISIFVPEKHGAKPTLLILQTLEDLFTATSITDIVFGEAVMPKPSTAVGWMRQDFFASFHFDNL